MTRADPFPDVLLTVATLARKHPRQPWSTLKTLEYATAHFEGPLDLAARLIAAEVQRRARGKR